MGNLLLSVIVVFLILGGPLTIYALIKISNVILGGLKVRFATSTDTAKLPHILISWDNESYDIQISRIKIEFDELVKGGRSKMLSFTFQDSKAKKKSFALPMQLTDDEQKCFWDLGTPGLRNVFQKSYFLVEVETISGETQSFKFSKAKVQKQLLEAQNLKDKDIDLSPETPPDQWSVLTRVFPWRKVEEIKEEAAPAAAGAVAKPAASDAPRAPVDFQVTKVWIEPGCIVCDACENEAPAVFWVKEDTCVIRENAPLDDGASIKAAAEGCPVDVIKYDTIPLKTGA